MEEHWKMYEARRLKAPLCHQLVINCADTYVAFCSIRTSYVLISYDTHVVFLSWPDGFTLTFLLLFWVFLCRLQSNVLWHIYRFVFGCPMVFLRVSNGLWLPSVFLCVSCDCPVVVLGSSYGIPMASFGFRRRCLEINVYSVLSMLLNYGITMWSYELPTLFFWLSA